jgi:putative phage-type endonuclease
MKLINLKQRSKEWLTWRATKICASDAPIITGHSPFKTVEQLYNEKTKCFESAPNSYMRRGLDLEPIALREFEKETGLIMFACVGEHENGWMAASFDGMTLEQDAIVEIKCPGKKDHFAALNGIIPDKYKAQLNHQMVVADVQEMFYFSFDGEKGVIIEVKRDDKFIEIMIEKEREFWERLQQQLTPSSHSIVA